MCFDLLLCFMLECWFHFLLFRYLSAKILSCFGTLSFLVWVGLCCLLGDLSHPLSRCIAYRSTLQEMYDVDLLLQVTHFSEHQLDFTLIAFLFQRSNVFLKSLDVTLKFRFNALQSKQVSSFPLILLGVVIGFPLHFLSLANPSSGRVDWKALWVLISRHAVINLLYSN